MGLGDRYASAAVTTRILKVKKRFPPGTAVVYLDQKNANLAVEVLEPEAENGFVQYGIIKAEKGSVLPVYRYTKAKNKLPDTNHIKNYQL